MRLKINGYDITFFTELNVSRSLDSIASKFSFKSRFNPENDLHKELFKPLQYHKVEIFNSENKLILTGTILNHAFSSDKDISLVSISGYSVSGILEDVTIPVSAYPLESINRSLKDIATRLFNLFGIGLIIDSSVANLANQIFETTTASNTESIKSYISKLTSQKNIVLSHNERGQVVMFKPNDDMKPKYYFNKDNVLLTGATAQFSGQGLHSEINCVRQPSDENEGVSSADSITNPLIKKYRPTTKTLSSGEDVDVSHAANNELASELSAISVSLSCKGLLDDINPGDIVNVHLHEIYSFAYNRYMVSEVTLKENEKEDTTDLSLVLPETFTGKQPRDILFYYESHKRHN